jgi:hypothetical protein
MYEAAGPTVAILHSFLPSLLSVCDAVHLVVVRQV